MRNFCRIENNRVMEIFDLDAHHPDAPSIDGIFPPSIDWRVASTGCAEGWVILNGAIVPPDYYAVLRAREYPPMADYIDGMVKAASTDATIKAAGLAQVAAYGAACLAIKAKYPR